MKPLASLLSVIVLGMSTAGASASDLWQPAEPPNHPWPAPARAGAVLADGRILLAGGSGTASRTEVFDPATGRWKRAADMLTGQSGPAAARLPDGRVLIAAGCSPIYCVNSRRAEVYDPSTDTWRSVANMIGARTQTTAVALADGRVLVVGGSSAAGAFLPVNPPAELYDPSTDTWSATGPMLATRTLVTATRLDDGRVLVVGGGSSAEVFDPTTNAWTPAGSLGTVRILHSAVLLGDGRVLVAGGHGPEPRQAPRSSTRKRPRGRRRRPYLQGASAPTA